MAHHQVLQTKTLRLPNSFKGFLIETIQVQETQEIMLLEKEVITTAQLQKHNEEVRQKTPF